MEKTNRRRQRSGETNTKRKQRSGEIQGRTRKGERKRQTDKDREAARQI